VFRDLRVYAQSEIPGRSRTGAGPILGGLPPIHSLWITSPPPVDNVARRWILPGRRGCTG